jgi:hypothetical protein
MFRLLSAHHSITQYQPSSYLQQNISPSTSVAISIKMYFKNIIAAATVALFAGQAMGAALIATDPSVFPSTSLQAKQSILIFLPIVVSACNCPNNCSHKAGSSCKFYSGPSDSSPVSSGRE